MRSVECSARRREIGAFSGERVTAAYTRIASSLKDLERRWTPLLTDMRRLIDQQLVLINTTIEYVGAIRSKSEALRDYCECLLNMATSVSAEQFENYIERLRQAKLMFSDVKLLSNWTTTRYVMRWLRRKASWSSFGKTGLRPPATN